jgi:aspartate dehydrogenase
MSMHSNKSLRVGIAGLGAVGMPVARWLDTNIDGLILAGVSAGDKDRATARVANFNSPPPVLDLSELVATSDVVVEGLPPALFSELAEPAVKQGKTLIVMTLTSLLERLDLVNLAKQTGATIIAATGALVGFDALRAAAKGEVYSVVMKTRKPPQGLKKAPFVIEQGFDLDSLTEPLCLYKGSVRDAAAKFPANVNVAVALALAGIGPDRTEYEIWADPDVERNTHAITVDADSVHLELAIANVPSEENPATGKLTALSAIATLERLVSPFTVGT